jgi:hypothetical protein
MRSLRRGAVADQSVPFDLKVDVSVLPYPVDVDLEVVAAVDVAGKPDD